MAKCTGSVALQDPNFGIEGLVEGDRGIHRMEGTKAGPIWSRCTHPPSPCCSFGDALPLPLQLGAACGEEAAAEGVHLDGEPADVPAGGREAEEDGVGPQPGVGHAVAEGVRHGAHHGLDVGQQAPQLVRALALVEGVKILGIKIVGGKFSSFFSYFSKKILRKK